MIKLQLRQSVYIQFQKQIIKTYFSYQRKFLNKEKPSQQDYIFQLQDSSSTHIQMIDNYVEYEYKPCHLIYQSGHAENANLFLGDVSSALDLDFLQKSNIKTVVTAAASMDQVSYSPQDRISHVVYSVLDHKNQNLSKYFDEFYDLVQRQIKKGSILVHCAAGISRSSTLVISYIMKKHNWTFKQSIKFVRNSRPMVLPNLGFQRQLKQYEKLLLQQQQRRLKSKTSQSNKHSENNGQILPDIGILGQTSTHKKILQGFRIYKKDDDNQKYSRRNLMLNYQGGKLDKKFNLIKYNHHQKYRPFAREFGQTKSASLQHAVQRNVRMPAESHKITPYIQIKTDQSQITSSRRQLVSRNGLFDSAIIPIKYSSTNKPIQRLKKTNIQFTNLNSNNITINRINIFKQKYVNNSPIMNGMQLNGNTAQFGINQNIENSYRNQGQRNVLQLKTKQNFTRKLSQVRQISNEINSFPIMVVKKEITSLKRQIGPIRKLDHAIPNEQNIKIPIKNFLFQNQ